MSDSPTIAEKGGPRTESQPLSQEPQGQSAAASGASLSQDDQEFREKYRVVECSAGALEEGSDEYHPIDFILLLKKDPKIAAYVEEISYWPGGEDEEDDEGDDEDKDGRDEDDEGKDDESMNDPQSKIQKAWPVLSAQLDKIGLSPEQTGEWTQALKKGGASPCFTLLMSMLPNVRVLQLPDESRKTVRWLNALVRGAQSPASTQLSQLSHVLIQHGDTEFNEPLTALEELIFLPSMRKVSGHMMGANDGDPWTPSRDITTETSPVEYVQLNYSENDANATLQLITPMKNLRALDYACYLGDWEMSGYDDEDAFRADFEAKLVPLLNQRGLVWKIGVFGQNVVGACGDPMSFDKGYRIRCAELAHELDDVEETRITSNTKITRKPAGTDEEGNEIEVITYSIGG